jgi:hypothetical protein
MENNVHLRNVQQSETQLKPIVPRLFECNIIIFYFFFKIDFNKINDNHHFSFSWLDVIYLEREFG